ncbi:MAG: coenzyme F420-0:L-glutamate ligase [Methanobrevibacter sp.]|jgi:F420-0:gamma-glutamyl ligase-like protein|nr:coenzyme F420-0:L-glutamate ligase [Methanobrevibacter sp.]
MNIKNSQYDSLEKKLSSDEYEIIPIETGYIAHNEDLNQIILPAIELSKNNDYLVIAETPIAVSQGRLLDETDFKPSLMAKFLGLVWSKYLWGYFFGPILRIKKRTIKNLRHLPYEVVYHKELVLKTYGLKHALKPASEAGIDLSNAPGTYVSLLPKNPQKVAKNISQFIFDKTGRNVSVLIVDTDATYRRGKNKYFTGLPIAIEGIKSNMGFWGYVLGQIYKNVGSTPLGSSHKISVEEALKIANISENYQKSLENNMETIYQMKKNLSRENNQNKINNENNNRENSKKNMKDSRRNDDFSNITVEMLNSIVHTPAVLIRKK